MGQEIQHNIIINRNATCSDVNALMLGYPRCLPPLLLYRQVKLDLLKELGIAL